MSDRHVTFDMILGAVSATTGYSLLELRSDRRGSDLTQARFAAWWLASKLTALSLPIIGRLTGGRDPGTVASGMQRAEELRSQVPEFRLALDTMLGTLRTLQRADLLRFAAMLDPVAVARRVLAAPEREAVRVSTYEIIAMSQALVALHGDDDHLTPSPLSKELEHVG
ncbi:helix-turn-helix domain-containing protein [Bosea sp. 2KB_26]|uniref:helix-turn-helix domain-containing protein n=1 Tax=Bosea sp. 2KB_26 TaxID=3237475 RepID=UPI003F924957